MAQDNQDRTLKELAAPDVTYQPLGIAYPELDVDFELKSGLIHLLPRFHGLAGEDPHKHLKEFHVVCSTMKPQGISEDHIKLRAFPFSLADAAKDWLYYLQPGSVTSWNELKRLFLEKFFPASRAAAIRKDICGIRQMTGETLHEYWERFKKLCSSCPHHQISDQLLIQYFYEGLLPMDRQMIDAASGGALVDKTPMAARDLISNMAANSQQFGTRMITSRSVNEMNTSYAGQQVLENRIDELTSLVRQLAMNQQQVQPSTARVCGICSCPSHTTDSCPTLQEEDGAAPQAYAANSIFPGRPAYSYQQQQQQQPSKYDPYSTTYNPGWRDHSNFKYGNLQQPQSTKQLPLQQTANPIRPPNQPYQQNKPFQHPAQNQQPSQPSLEDLFKQLATNNIQLQQEMSQFRQRAEANFQNLETQMGQLASDLSELKAQGSDKLPSQTVPNPRSSVSAITLRSGRELNEPTIPREVSNKGKEKQTEQPENSADQLEPVKQQQQQHHHHHHHQPDKHAIPLPFPNRMTQSRKLE